MALGPGLKRAVRRIADILGLYARRQGWGPLDYRLYFHAERKWGILRVLLISPEFGRADFKAYEIILDFLRGRLRGEPVLFESVELDIRSFSEVAQGGLYSISDQYSFVRPRDLEKVTLRMIPELIDHFAKRRGLAGTGFGLLYRWEAESDSIHLIFHSPTLPEQDPPFPDALRALLKDRLFDEPEVLRSFRLDFIEDTQGEESRLEALTASGYKEFFSLTPA